MGRTWGDMERACSVQAWGDMERTWEEHGETWIVVTCGMWGDVITWEGHGETWEGHGKNTETQEERVLWGHGRQGKNMGRTWEEHGESMFMCGVWGNMG